MTTQNASILTKVSTAAPFVPYSYKGHKASSENTHVVNTSVVDTHVKALAKLLFEEIQHAPLVKEPGSHTSFLSTTGYASQDFTSDVSSFIRAIRDTPVNAISGITTTLHSFLGLVALNNARNRVLRAEQIGYKGGALAAKVDMLRGAVQSLGGSIFIGVRGLSFLSFIKGIDASSIHAPTLLGRVTFVLGALGGAVWGLLSLVLDVMFLMNLYFGHKFEKEFDQNIDVNKLLEPKTMTDEELVNYVKYIEKWTLAGPEKDAIDKINSKYTPEELIDEALTLGADLLEKLYKETLTSQGFSPLNFSKDQLKEVVSTIFSENVAEGESPIDALAELGMMIKLAKLQIKRETKLGNLTSGAYAEELKCASAKLKAQEPLSTRMQSKDVDVKNAAIAEARGFVTETASCIQKMKETLGFNAKINWGYVAVMTSLVLLTCASFIFTGGVGPLVVGILFAITYAGMTALDGYCFQKKLESASVGKMDKIMLVITSILALTSIAVGISVISIFSLGIVPLIIVLAIGISWLAINGITWSKMIQNDRKEKGQHFTLEEFQELLLKGIVQADTLQEAFSKLPKAEQEALKEIAAELDFEDMTPWQIEFNKAVQMRLASIESAKHAEGTKKESLRVSLQSIAQQYFAHPQPAAS